MKTNILGVHVDAITFEEATKKTIRFLGENKSHVVFTPNPEFIMLAQKDQEVKKALNLAELVIPDGIGVVWASRLNKVKITERVPGYDFCLELFKRLENSGKTFYFFGSAPGVAEKAKTNIERQYPGIKIVGTSDGYFDVYKEKLIKQDISEKKPDILLVGLTAKKQVDWISKNKEILPVKVFVGVGGSLDGYSGKVRRAPEIFRKLNLEWFYRLLEEPKRIKRQLILPVFVIQVIMNKLIRRQY